MASFKNADCKISDDMPIATLKSNPGNALELLLDIQRLRHHATLKVPKELASSEAPVELHTNVGFATLSLHRLAHETALAFLFLLSELREMGNGLHTHDLRSDISASLAVAKANSEFALNMDEELGPELQSANDHAESLVRASAFLRTWFQHAAKVVQFIRCTIYVYAASDMHKMAVRVESHTPRYDHYLNDEVFGKILVRKHLLGSPYRESFGKESALLWDSLAQVAMLGKQVDLMDGFAIDQESIDFGKGVFQAAKNTLIIMAASSIVLSMTGTEQTSHAKSMVDKWQDILPKELLRQLQLLIDNVKTRA